MTYNTRKPKVIYLNFESIGGMLHYAVNLANASALINNETTYLDVGYAPTSLLHQEKFKTRFFELPLYSNKILRSLEKYNPYTFYRLAKFIANETEPDFVHITSTSVGLFGIVFYLKLFGIRVIYTVHDPAPHSEMRTTWGHLFTWYQSNVQMRLVSVVSDRLHVHSKLHSHEIRSQYGDRVYKKTYVVAHGGGVPNSVASGRQVPRELLKHRRTCQLSILFFGRIEEYKGIQYLVQAYNLLIEGGANIELIIAGFGGMTVKVSEDVLLINRFIADEEIAKIFEVADVVVLPYSEATQSGVIPLSYYFHKPVICTAVGALPDAVIDGVTGFIVPAKDSSVIADALRKLLDSPELCKKMGASANQYLNLHLNWNAIAAEHFEQYLKIV